MSGIVGTFQMMTQFTSIAEQPNGYCHLGMATGGSLVNCNDANPDGQWTIFLKYYASLLDYQNGAAAMNVDDFFYLDGITKVFQQISLPYVPHSDPFDAAKVVLQLWWPTGIVVP